MYILFDPHSQFSNSFLYQSVVPFVDCDFLTSLTRYPILVPAGLANFPREILPPPKSWVEASCSHLVSFTVMKKGGHFAAFEEPDAFSEDVRQFVYKVETLSS